MDSKNAILALNTDPFFCPFSSLKRNPIRTYVSESKTESESAILALNMDPNHSNSETDRKRRIFSESKPFGFRIGKYFAHWVVPIKQSDPYHRSWIKKYPKYEFDPRITLRDRSYPIL
ncbi:hypothetical protein ACFE04_019446 [Oxalis oulophora]